MMGTASRTQPRPAFYPMFCAALSLAQVPASAAGGDKSGRARIRSTDTHAQGGVCKLRNRLIHCAISCSLALTSDAPNEKF